MDVLRHVGKGQVQPPVQRHLRRVPVLAHAHVLGVLDGGQGHFLGGGALWGVLRSVQCIVLCLARACVHGSKQATPRTRQTRPMWSCLGGSRSSRYCPMSMRIPMRLR